MAKPVNTKFPRKWHEDFAATSTKEAVRLSRGDYGCNKEAMDRLIEANRSIAQARTHLVSIGLHSNKRPGRTARLWSAIGKAERQVDQAGANFLRCVINKRR